MIESMLSGHLMNWTLNDLTSLICDSISPDNFLDIYHQPKSLQDDDDDGDDKSTHFLVVICAHLQLKLQPLLRYY